ncbi:hypothetical protein Tco_1072468 [Tanacetum coccineum]
MCKIFSKFLTARVTGWGQPPLQVMQMLYCFVNNIHVDYAELLWEGLYYSLHHPTSSISYLRFTKIINIFNSRRHKDRVGMQIPAWMISEEMKHTMHYRMYTEVFRIDVPLTQISARLTPPAPVPTVDKAGELILQDTLQVSLAEHKRSENVVDDSLSPRNDEHNILDTRIEPRSDKESPKVEITNDEEVEITNVVIHVNVNDEKEEITDEVYELKRREKRKIVEEYRNLPIPTPIRSPKIHTTLGRYGYLFTNLRARFMPRKSFDTLANHLQEVMVESLPTMVDSHIKKQVPEPVCDQVPIYVAEGLILERQKNKEEMERLISKAILQERGNVQA